MKEKRGCQNSAKTTQYVETSVANKVLNINFSGIGKKP